MPFATRPACTRRGGPGRAPARRAAPRSRPHPPPQRPLPPPAQNSAEHLTAYRRSDLQRYPERGRSAPEPATANTAPAAPPRQALTFPLVRTVQTRTGNRLTRPRRLAAPSRDVLDRAATKAEEKAYNSTLRKADKVRSVTRRCRPRPVPPAARATAAAAREAALAITGAEDLSGRSSGPGG